LKLRKVINHGNPRWRVSVYIGSKRRQRFFKTKERALGWMSALIKEDPSDRFWSRLSSQERHQIMAQKRQGGSPGSCPNLESTPLEPAIESYHKIKEGQNLRPLTMRQIRWKLGMLLKAFGGSQCHEITTTMLEDWFRVKGWKRSTIDGAMAKVYPF
jgi:hypothetical protein